uniref:SMP-30/Gluconolactonase/LRE-like region domain-containing protein n=1 Tax=Roseihalotalea indica TaxID=2867963 RepID=A0AA49GP67_9BACT|nr:hypothetical protein K4G66_06870 [Tunicatimonas sp. TK19036]
MYTRPLLNLFSFPAFTLASLAFLLFSTSCQHVDDILDELRDRDIVADLPERIDVMQPGLFPEGVAFDRKKEKFLVTSVGQGTIGLVDDEGTYEPFIEDERFRSTIGIELDEARKQILVPVTQSDGSYGALGIYDQYSGDPVHYVELTDLTPEHPVFANDVAVDKNGNAYVTNSYNGVIYKVDRNGEASLFFVSEDFVPPSGAFGFNGIVYHPKGFLIVAYSAENALYKFPIDNPENYSKITLDTELQNPDGLFLSRNNQQLVVVNNAGGSEAGKVLVMESGDAWDSAYEESRFETGPVFPTTATQRSNEYYVLYAHLNEQGSNPEYADYAIVKVSDD